MLYQKTKLFMRQIRILISRFFFVPISPTFCGQYIKEFWLWLSCDKNKRTVVQIFTYFSAFFMRGSRKLWQRGSNFDHIFFRRGKGGFNYHYKRAIIGPPVKRHQNGVSLACRCWSHIESWFGSSVIFQGIGPILLRNLNVFAIFQRGGGVLRIRACSLNHSMIA